MAWVAQNWYIAWALFCIAAIVIAVTRYRETAAVRLLARIWKWLTALAITVAVLGMVLMLIGSFTVEWTCHCNVPGHWKCRGASCNAEATAHFDTYRHDVSCTRTDWPMRVLAGVGNLLVR